MTVDEYLLEKERPVPGALLGTLEDGTPVRQAKETSTPVLSFIGADALLGKQFGEMREAVNGMFVEGLTLLCGASKIGKSWLVLQLCCAVASGRPFLGRPTEQGDVLYLALEDSERRLKARLTKLGEAPGSALSFATQCRTLDDGLLDDLHSWAEAVQSPRLIVIDTLQKVRGGATPSRANAYAADYAAMSRLKSFADERHIAVVLVHHLNKMKDVSDPYDRISGSTGLMGAADTTILIARERDSDDAKVILTGRDVWSDDFMLRMRDGRWSAVSGEALERETYEENPIVQTCRALLKESFGEQVRITLQDFLDASVRCCGMLAAATKNELSTKLQAIAPELSKYDGILVSAGKRVGSQRGVYLSKGGLNHDPTNKA